MVRLHGPRAPLAPQHRDRSGKILLQQLEERPGIQCGRHDQQPQIITQALLANKRKGKPQIGVQAALMKLVKNQAADALKLGIVLEHPGQDAFGHHRNPGGRAHPGIQAHPISHGLADLFPKQRSHVPGRVPGRHAPGLQHQDAFAVEPCRPEQCQGNPRRLARAGRRFKYTSGPAAQCFKQIREQGLNGQDFCGMIEHAPL